MYDVVALGELLIDFSTQNTNDAGYPIMSANPGGAPGNFLAALSRYGAKTAFLGKVGDDAFGRLLVKTLCKAGVETCGIVIDPDVFTTLAFVTIDALGDRSFSFARKPGADTQLRFDELDLSLIAQTRVFHFGTLSLTDDPARTATKEAVQYAKYLEKIITFDPNLRLPLWRHAEDARCQILWGLKQADVVKISDEEVQFLWDCSPRDGARCLLEEYGVSLAMVTLGSKGCYLCNACGECTVPCPNVHPVDTTGAGDIFGGSAVGCLLHSGKRPQDLTVPELAQIAQFATTAASMSTEAQGGIPSIPAMEDVLMRIDQGE